MTDELAKRRARNQLTTEQSTVRFWRQRREQATEQHEAAVARVRTLLFPPMPDQDSA